ncbi:MULTISPECIES: lysozyme inhibitor LprI family protein [Agrobacterium]|uniref:lysozyme inhibitor LprI family protein n=1 Tax=Agrobacterium TaxID=357 RepID=UPI00277D192F|nr:lysozyme inhibitor LprI family protein [Agrobacterium sp. SORGH_AS_0745]MDP9762139.1 uncharacterized protein YecT (DUF1311 family) [Agrobacterium tumefaciens]MDQ1220572.1 uncharacterized protein YecT (DUF1311 family) [Agrobacterium sp. SORGH_AS_0745]
MLIIEAGFNTDGMGVSAMFRIGWLTLPAAMLLCGVEPASAAEIEKFDLPGIAVPFVSIRGPIEAGDGEKFETVVRGVNRASVILQSPGGLVKEALHIGATIRIEGFATMVPADKECFSACGLIWVSGVRRYMSDTSQIGFHAAYREENGEYRESGIANAEIGSYLTHLGLRIEAIRYFTAAGPNDFLLLTPGRARMLGIETYKIDGANITTPSAAPTVDVYADRFVSLSLLQSRCAPFLQPDTAAVKRSQEEIFAEGNKLVGSDKWIDLWTRRLEDVKSGLNNKGALLVCIETEASLRGQGQETGIHGPSFSCASATTPTEMSLCRQPELWAKDRAMNSIYMWVRNNVEKSVRKRLLEVQRSWLKDRNDCGGDARCLNTVYDQRLIELRAIDLPG